ncbi:AIG2-like protein D [Phalaenopsis equestris]|uniref:AIG2-like protein D n=1 Tax=Phalaenopsis equestris TaxID=78828 RepID=UPI0009E3A29B|nr:AIG2-like protein D [Phalaenopsis equestris]
MTTISATAAAPSLPLHNVFVYGSLLADEVVSKLLSRVPPCTPAILNGYHRYNVKGRVYPAILPAERKKVIGRVIMGVTKAELCVLDTFEDEEYKRSTVEVFLNGDSGKLSAETYVWADKDDPNLYGEWDFEEWKQLHLKDFLSMTEGFVKELEKLDLKTRVAIYEAYYKK